VVRRRASGRSRSSSSQVLLSLTLHLSRTAQLACHLGRTQWVATHNQTSLRPVSPLHGAGYLVPGQVTVVKNGCIKDDALAPYELMDKEAIVASLVELLAGYSA
jgi:hypothetical protein